MLPVHADNPAHKPLAVATQQQLSLTLLPQRPMEIGLEAKCQQLLKVLKSIVDMNATGQPGSTWRSQVDRDMKNPQPLVNPALLSV